MKKNKEEKNEAILPDLKQDSMEYFASTTGDEQFQILEEEEITVAEMNNLEQKDIEEEAYALNAAITDSQADVDNFLIEPSEQDEFDEAKNDDVNI